MAGKINLLVERVNLTSTVPTGTQSGAQWSVKVNGKVVGYVDRAIVSDDGRPRYVAHYLRDDGSTKTVPSVFGGEFGNVEAVSVILDRLTF